MLQLTLQIGMDEAAKWRTLVEPGVFLRDRWQKRGALKLQLWETGKGVGLRLLVTVMWPRHDSRISHKAKPSRWQGHYQEASSRITGLPRATSQHSGDHWLLVSGCCAVTIVLQWLQARGNPSQDVQAVRKMSHLDHVIPVALHLQSDHIPDSGSRKILYYNNLSYS